MIPPGWPDEFDPETAEATIAVAEEEQELAPGSVNLALVVELRWAIAQLRAERAAR